MHSFSYEIGPLIQCTTKSNNSQLDIFSNALNMFNGIAALNSIAEATKASEKGKHFGQQNASTTCCFNHNNLCSTCSHHSKRTTLGHRDESIRELVVLCFSALCVVHMRKATCKIRNEQNNTHTKKNQTHESVSSFHLGHHWKPHQWPPCHVYGLTSN